MTRPQALIIAVIIGFVALVFIGMIVLLFFPYERIFPPTPTAPPPPPTVTATPTLPNFLPTASLITPSVEPTATNTRLPTVTPPPARTPTPTVIIRLPTQANRATATAVQVATIGPESTNTPPPGPTPTPIPRHFIVSFEAGETTIVKGECTDLKWKVQGASVVMLEGKTVDPSGEQEVCPERDRRYQLTMQLPDSKILVRRMVLIIVEDE